MPKFITAKSIGVEDANSPFSVIEAIRTGLTKESIDNVALAYEVHPQELGRFIHLSPRTISRFKPNHPLSQDTSDHIFQLWKVYHRAVEVFSNPDKAIQWLKTPSRALGSQEPYDLLDTSTGVEMVLDELGRIEYGVFS